MNIGDCMAPRIHVLEGRTTIKRKIGPQIKARSTLCGVDRTYLEHASLSTLTRLVDAGSL